MVTLRQSTSKNTVVIGGERAAAITLIASKMLENLAPCVDHKIARSITTAETDPTDSRKGAVSRLRTKPLYEIDRDQCSGTVQCGQDRAHESGEDCRQDQPFEPRRD